MSISTFTEAGLPPLSIPLPSSSPSTPPHRVSHTSIRDQQPTNHIAPTKNTTILPSTSSTPVSGGLLYDSTPRSPASTSQSEKKWFACSHPGCSKAFGRRDYLERHAANHMTSRPYFCGTCGKSYARADVLKRHVSNHPRSRDKIANSNNTGDSRIRRRRNGKEKDIKVDLVIKSSPPLSPPPTAPTTEKKNKTDENQGTETEGKIGGDVVVPPNWTDTPSTSTTTSVNAPDYGMSWVKYSAEHNEPQAQTHVQGQSQTQSQTQAQNQYVSSQQAYPPSFSPATTQQIHNTQIPPQLPSNQNSYQSTSNFTNLPFSTDSILPPPTDLSQVPMFNFDTGETIANDLYTWFLTSDLNDLLPPTNIYGLNTGTDMLMSDDTNNVQTSSFISTNMENSYVSGSGASHLGNGQGQSTSRQEHGVYSQMMTQMLSYQQEQKQGQNSWLPVVENGCELDDSATEGSERLITAALCRKIHEDVFQLFDVKFPKEGFSAVDMNLFVDLYYLHFEPLFPVIHRPTLKARNPPTILLLAMLSIGSTYSSEKGPHRVFVELHKKLRRHVFDMVEGSLYASTQVLQTLVLISYFGRMHSTSHDYDVNQLYYSSIITVSRYSGLFTASTSHWTHAKLVGPAAWCTWAEAEERIRLAWMVFICDQSNAAFFRQGIMLQSSNMDVPLPCNDAAWGAETAEAWAQDRGDEPLSFRPTLRQLLDETTLPPGLDSFALWAVLHGLVALANALSSQRPDMFTLARRTQITAWKGIVYRAFALWHQTALNMLSSSIDPSSLSHLRAGVPICNICIIILLTDLDAVRMFAGAPRLGGREIQLEERSLARTRLETWAQSSEGRQSCWFALELLQQVFRWSGEGEASFLPPTTQWCIYLATVTVWAFTTLVEERHVDVKRLNLVGPYTKCRVEPTLARRSALNYCERILACEEPVNLPTIPEIGQCLAVIAYTAYLCGSVGNERGYLVGPTRVLYNLLRITETRKRNTFVTC